MSDRAITFWGAVGALLLLVAMLYTPSQESNVSRPTSEEAGPNGYLALSRWLEEEGVATASVRRRFKGDTLSAMAPGAGHVLITTLPHRRLYRADEAEHLRDWVAKGNTLVALVALDETPDWSLTVDAFDMFEDLEAITGLGFDEAVTIETEDGEEETLEVGSLFGKEELSYLPMAAHPLMAGVTTLSGITDFPSSIWLPDLAQGDVFAARLAYEQDYGLDSLWQVPHGNGDIFVSASSSLLANRQLGAGDNARFFANLLAWHLGPGGVVMFDDVHQGLSDLYDPEAFFTDERLHSTLWFILGFWLLYLLGGAARLAASNSGQASPQQADLVAAVGRLMERKLAAADAGRAMIDTWLGELRRAGMLSAASTGSFPAEELARLPAIDEQVLREVHETYSKLGRGGKVDLAQLHNNLQTLRDSMI